MKKILIWMLVCVLCLSMAGCGMEPEQRDDGKITIVATIFPEYDWLRNLTAGSENIELKLLIDKGVDLHSYQPDVNDIVTISSCDVFVYTGGSSDVWVEDVIETAMNPDLLVIDLMEILEQHRELCEDDHDHDHDGEEAEHHDHTADEHIWLSLVNAEHICGSLTEILQQLDDENAGLYAENLGVYSEKLKALHNRYEAMAAEADYEDVLFADRFPFAYLMEDYGLHHHAAYEGCSAETEVSFDTFANLAEVLNELNLPCVVVIDDSDHRIADTVIATSGDASCRVLTLQSMQAVGRSRIRDGVTYLDIMEENLFVLEQALNEGA